MSNDTQPEIRFPGFTEAWEQRKLGEFVTIRSGWSPSNFEEANDKGSLFVKVDDLNSSTRVQNNSNMKVIENPKYDKMKQGSTIFPKRGAAIMTNKVRILGENGYMDTNMMALEPSGIVGEFLYTFISRTGLYKIADTSTIPQINNKHIEPYEISLPEIKEQQKIGIFFKQLDDTITLHQSKLDLLKETKKGFLQKMFPKNGAKVPEIRFPGFTEDWEQRKLGDLGSVAMNKRIFKDQTSDNGEVPFFKIGTFGSHPDAFISRELFEEYKSKYPYPEVGDILISASGSIGRTVVYQGEDEYFQDSNIVWLKHNGRLDNKFLQQFYSIVKWQGLEGSTIKRLYNKNILDTNISVPTLDEQNKLGAFFEQLDDTIALQQRKLDLLKETKKGFLQKMFV
ncbi:restriction endonuclease subunit S [Enterococcus faecalis]|nr:restriction endonuclease subunit S [Enterococcus faecalis]